MSQKFFAQNSDIVRIPSLPPVNRRPIILIVIATILAIALAFVVAGQAPAREEAANTTPATAIVYSNALAMQYAQPYLNAQSSTVSFSNALELQYAQPYLKVQSSVVASALELQYAQPYLKVQSPVVASALELQYAQPWITGESVQYGNALELQYAEANQNT
jgi:hypothetical protein